MRKSKWVKSLKDGIQKDMVLALAQLGHDAMLYAYKMGNRGETSIDETIKEGASTAMYKRHARSKYKSQVGRWKHRSYNLHDSFASAVYINGKLASVEYLGSPRSTKRDKKTGKTGRETVDDYLSSRSFGSRNKEIVLVVVAAMYYTGILEKGGKSSMGPQDKFIVISPAERYIKKHYDEVIASIFNKYGIKTEPRTRVIQGEKLKK